MTSGGFVSFVIVLCLSSLLLLLLSVLTRSIMIRLVSGGVSIEIGSLLTWQGCA